MPPGDLHLLVFRAQPAMRMISIRSISGGGMLSVFAVVTNITSERSARPQIVIHERRVLSPDRAPEKRRRRSPRKSIPILSISSSRKSRLTSRLAHRLDDLAGHRAGISCAGGGFRFVAHAAGRHAHGLAPVARRSTPSEIAAGRPNDRGSVPSTYSRGSALRYRRSARRPFPGHSDRRSALLSEAESLRAGALLPRQAEQPVEIVPHDHRFGVGLIWRASSSRPRALP